MKPAIEIEILVKNNTRQGLSGVSGGIEGVEKDATTAQKRIQALEAEIARLHKVMAATPKMDQTENIRQIETLQRELQELQATAKKTDLTPVNAPAVQRTYNGLNVSIQQMARELPSLAMGPQMFFMAISNNLPIFTDELARARREYDLLTASGQKATPVWKQAISSIGSFQTLLAVGITLAVVYGKEIGNFVSSLFRGKNAFDAVARSAEAFHATMLEGSRNAQSEVVKLNLLYRAATDNTRAMDERLEATKRLKDEYPDYFKNLSDEQIMVGKASDAYKSLVANIYEYAKAQAAFKSMVDLEQQGQMFDTAANIDQYKRAYDKYLKAQEDVAAKRKIYEATTWAQRGNASKPYKDLTWAETLLLNARREMKDLQKLVFDEVKKYDGGEEIIDEIKERFDGNLGAFLQFIAEQRTKLAAIAEKAQLNDNPTNSPKQPENTDSVDQLGEQYQAAVLKQQQELSELSVAAMQEGADKEREQIRLDYEKKRQQYEDEERKMLALIKKLRASGADVDPGAEAQVMATSASALAAAAKLRDKQLEEVDKKEETTYEKLLQKYETYQQGRLRLAEKYDAEIAKLAADPRNQEVARQAKQKALDEFDVKFASQFPQFEAWADKIVRMSISELDDLLAQTQERLAQLQTDNPDDDTIGVANAEIVKLKEELARKRAELDNKTTDTTSWTELHRVLTDVVDTFDKAGDTIGGAAGEIVSAAGNIAGSTLQMVNTIQAFQKAKANKDTLGMASGILGGISSGINVLTTIFGLFDGGESSMERNLRLAREFNEELRIMKERSKIDSDAYDSIFGDRLYGRFKQNATTAKEAMEALRQAEDQIMNRGGEQVNVFSKGTAGLSGLDKVAKTWETVADSVYNMQVQTRHSTWFRSAKYASLGSLVPELFDDGELNMEALKKFVEEGGKTFQKLPAQNRKMLQQLTEDWSLYTEAMDSMRDYLNDIFGQLGNSMTEALISAAENGTDAFDAMAAEVGQTLRNLTKDMINSILLGPIIEKAQKEMEDITVSDKSDEDKIKAYTEVLKNMITDAAGQQGEASELWNSIKEWAEQQGIDMSDPNQGTSQSGKAGAVNTVTQEAFSRVEGLVTSIQIHEANVDKAVEEGIVPALGKSLDALNKIKVNTDALPLMYEMLSKFDREGIKVK